jgi:hypothetical protein
VTKPICDYSRLRRLPSKQCRGPCKRTLPNDREHFTEGPTGKLRSHCHDCALLTPASTKARQKCPCCGYTRRLCRDHNTPGPAPVLICRLCLMLVNSIYEASAQQLRNAVLMVQARRAAGTTPAPPSTSAQDKKSPTALRQPGQR